MAQARKSAGHKSTGIKLGSVTFRLDRENEVIKVIRHAGKESMKVSTATKIAASKSEKRIHLIAFLN